MNKKCKHNLIPSPWCRNFRGRTIASILGGEVGGGKRLRKGWDAGPEYVLECLSDAWCAVQLHV